MPVLYCNLAGATDSLIFDGRSFALDAQGRCTALAGWDEGLTFVDLDAQGPEVSIPRDRWDEVERALVAGIRGYMRKCDFRTAHVGISGGIDSALVAVLAAEAVGAENVTLLGMPSRFSSEGSISDSRTLAGVLGTRMETLPIEDPFKAFLGVLSPHFGDRPFDLAEENLQARIRGSLLMAWSNKFGSLLLTTGNKSELACGYCTLYGDMCGALAPIGDLLKTEVYALSRSINARWKSEGGIPHSRGHPDKGAQRRASTQPDGPGFASPLRPAGRHSGTVHRAQPFRRRDRGAGTDPALVRRVISMVARAEYKRRQAAPCSRFLARLRHGAPHSHSPGRARGGHSMKEVSRSQPLCGHPSRSSPPPSRAPWRPPSR